MLCIVCLGQLSAQNIEKTIGDFSELKVYDGLELDLIPSNENKVIISGEYKDKVQVVNKNGLLKIKLNIQKYYSGQGTHVSLYFKTLHILDANEGANISSRDVIKQSSLEIRAQEGAQIDLKVESNTLNVKAISGAMIKLEGKSNSQDIVVNSGGSYKAKELKTNDTKVTVTAGGSAKLFADTTVNATVQAGGNIRVYGNPKTVSEKKVIGGTITIVE